MLMATWLAVDMREQSDVGVDMVGTICDMAPANAATGSTGATTSRPLCPV